jgi:signal transduction histidine kinase/DNA-binding NarL/FixJ family response regulator/HPt (histidine-containing phosphotransfer) domain-containing protein
MPQRPDRAPAPFSRLNAAAPWIVRACLFVVAAIGLGAPFILPQMYAVWIAPPLVLAALGGWIGWRAYASADREPVVVQPAPVAIRPQLAQSSATQVAMQAELEKLRSVQSELMRAKQDAEAAMMAKSEFLATMSHEIRTPLNGIIPLLDIVLSTKLAPDQQDYLQTAYKSARELLRIVDDILDYSKMEANKLELETTGINLRELLDAVHRLLVKNAEAKGLNFSVVIEPGVRIAVRGDPTRLRQVLTNLVSNAIKFTERGSVMIHLSKHKETRTHYEYLFAVKDTGIGIAPETANKLFQAFTQADASTTRFHGGTGLGLAICQRIVELMQGKIGVRSEVGKGSMFWFSVPLLKALGDTTAIRKDLHGARALVMANDATIMRRLGNYFNSWGVTFQQTAAAPDALSKLRSAASMGESWAYDFLILDAAAIPPAAVLTLLRNINREPVLERVRCIYLSGDDAVPPDLTNDPRAAAVSRQAGEPEMRGAALKLLGVGEQAVEIVNPLPAALPPVQVTEPPEATKPIAGHVLLVEDNPVNRQVAQRLLTLMGISYGGAFNGKEALEQLEKDSYDVVLMDCQMPIMDGYTAVRILRQNEETSGKHLPVIAMTANAMAGDREKCLRAGMDDYMSKPLNRALMEQTLRKWLPPDAKSRGEVAVLKHAAAVPVPAAASSAPPARPAVIAPTAATSAAPGLAVLDTDVVRDLLDVMGDEFTDLVRVYLEDTPKSVGALEQAAARGDKEGLIAPSHSLKSTSANLGAMSLSELAKRLEHGARGGTLGDEAAVIVAEIKRTFQRVQVELNALLAKSTA